MIRVKVLVFIILLSAFSYQLSVSGAEAARSDSMPDLEKAFLEEKYENVVRETEKFIEGRSSQRDELYYLKGLSELKLGKFNDARKSFEDLISKYPRSNRIFEAHTGIGDSYFLENNTVKAVEIYMEILDKFPNDKNISIVYYRTGECHKALGRAGTKAQSYFNKAKGISPLSFELRLIEDTDKTEDVSKTNSTSREISERDPNRNISVQTGSFKSKKNAQKLAKELSNKGYESYVEAPAESGDNLYRVKVGAFKSKGDAASLLSRLEKDGYNTKVCDDKI